MVTTGHNRMTTVDRMGTVGTTRESRGTIGGHQGIAVGQQGLAGAKSRHKGLIGAGRVQPRLKGANSV